METIIDNRRQLLIGSALVVLGAIGFSAKTILIKLAYADSAQLDAITLMTLRMAMALPFFLAVALWSRGKEPRRHQGGDWAALVVLGIIGYYLASLLDFTGLEYISAGLGRLILFLYPTIVVLLVALVYRRPVSKPQRWALLLSYAGILLVVASNDQTVSKDLTLGAMLVFGSAVLFALFITGSGQLIPRFGSKRFTAYSMTVASVATIAHFMATKPIEQLAVSGRILGLALTLALVSTVAPAFLMSAGIRRVGADHAAIIGTVGPVATLAMAYFLLNETLELPQLFGSAMVLGGVLLVTLGKSANGR